MPLTVALLAVLAMLIGLVGTVVPFLPGLALVWAAAVGSWLLAGFGTAAWVSTAVVTLLLVAGTVAKFVLSTRTGRARRVPRRSMLLGLAGATVGFFVIPVVGFVVGGVVGVFLAEMTRTGERAAARDNTMAMLKSFGIGVLVEILAAVGMVVVWVGSVLVAGLD